MHAPLDSPSTPLISDTYHGSSRFASPFRSLRNFDTPVATHEVLPLLPCCRHLSHTYASHPFLSHPWLIPPYPDATPRCRLHPFISCA